MLKIKYTFEMNLNGFGYNTSCWEINQATLLRSCRHICLSTDMALIGRWYCIFIVTFSYLLFNKLCS